MRNVRPFDPARLAPGGAEVLLAAAEDMGCAVTLRRGGGEAPTASTAPGAERFALVLEGLVALAGPDGSASAAAGDLVVIPAGAHATVTGDAAAVWVDVEAGLSDDDAASSAAARVVRVDPARFEGEGFAYQSLVDRSGGARTMRMNVLKVQPGAGSPDFHIHVFHQLYVIVEGEMTIDIGRRRTRAAANSLVVLPAGLVHRNFNASAAVERHVTLLVPEPGPDDIFDYAVTIHDREAELLTELPL